jgi:hypothetical protein
MKKGLTGRPAAFGRWLLMIMVLLMGAQSMGAQESLPADSEESQRPDAGGTLYFYLPHISTGLPAVTLNPIGRPNSNNQWTVSWSGAAGATSYELQESQQPDFSVATTYTVATTSKLIEQALSFVNVFYYRVRAVSGSSTGPWSNVQSVMGGYRDNFDDPNSGWAMRRTTYLKKVIGVYYNGNYGILATDNYEWGIFSPLRPAPPVPYAIEYRSILENQKWALASHGAVFGGDWTSEPCPDYSSLEGLYEHEICFNHFYNTNLIWYVGNNPVFKLILERVDYLQWCPECGGSPMKRLSNDYDAWVEKDPVPNANPLNWNTWRIEVRADGIKLFANGQQYAEMNDSSWVNDPYYGLFVSSSTNEVSSWLVDYYQVTYLDN